MKTLILGAALAVLACVLSACTTTSATAMAPITNAIAAEIPHCHVSGSFQAGAGGIAGTGTGVAATNTFDCPAQPWPASTSAAATPAATATAAAQ